MMLHPEARDALVIGLGGGATAGAVSIHDGVDVDVVELAGSVARGARFLDSINYNVLTRPNVHLHIDDGRNFMLLTRRKYDVVTADVILPIYRRIRQSVFGRILPDRAKRAEAGRRWWCSGWPAPRRSTT